MKLNLRTKNLRRHGLAIALLSCLAAPSALHAKDPIADLQAEAITTGKAEFGHWGPNKDKYSSWTTHSNRLIPVYSFGGNLDQVSGENSVYRSAEGLTKLYGTLPPETLNPQAEYFDQTDVYRLQEMAAAAGKKHIVLFVFDGMDWQTTRAAAIAKSGAVKYDEGRGTGLYIQDYAGTETDFGYCVTSPHNNGTSVSVDKQRVTNPGGKTLGGYDPARGGEFPWSEFPDANYPISAGDDENKHAYTDSSSSATSLTSGIKTYNNAVNVDFAGREALSIARKLQADGFATGAVTSVPISHATPASAYASNVHRGDYQDITRDLLGLPSIFHPGGLPGLDVLIGAGWGETAEKDGGQGENFVPGNKYLTTADQQLADVANGGNYVIAERTAGQPGPDVLNAGVQAAIENKQRLLGYFGASKGHLPFQTADGGYNPVANTGNASSAKAESYSSADIEENVTLSQMTTAALEVLDARSERWWLMIEAGDVDWGNHSNNIDNSIGAVLSGDMAFKTLVDWVDAQDGWEETFVVVTSDHGHYLVLDQPELLAQ
ncbi:alkaline phosphatase [Aureliella helgolandensis]|uniref:Alkaline phosphatase H n=1 Tax=Aureliella helgolandensis TaxID=2527968 RepID=A0A518GFM2_9BACT|nr:alkaline phosphatase [Aureliella helgolandensis]QDV27396.1 Alkaline phosphatase H precursor [Aureliella helgolandensis]